MRLSKCICIAYFNNDSIQLCLFCVFFFRFRCRRLPSLKFFAICLSLIGPVLLYRKLNDPSSLGISWTARVVMPNSPDSEAAVSVARVTQHANDGTPRPVSVQSSKHTLEKVADKRERVIRIIKWTPPVKNWAENGRFRFDNCETTVPCEYVAQSSYNSSDIIMINAYYLRYEREMPSYRLPHQKWMFYHTEAPRLNHFRYLTRYLTSFNMTMTYTHDADIVKPYGICLPDRNTIKTQPDSVTDYIRKVYGTLTDAAPWLRAEKRYVSYNRAKDKSRLVAWMVSHCFAQNKRNEYVSLLQRHIPIDIYGACGNLTCFPKLSKACDQKINKKYKFYLAFENSLCSEYITEKVWRRLDGEIIPIVLGNAEYDKYLPKHSYINIKDFSSPKKLATYLKLLDRDEKLYNEYFNWTKAYTCHNAVPGMSMSCNICQHANDNINIKEIGPNINQFWSYDMCTSPTEFYKGVANIVT